MSVVVTGSNGFLGTALIERLLEQRETGLVAFVRPGSNRARLDALRARYPDSGLEIRTGTLASPAEAGRAIDGASVVYHLAASLSGAPADMTLNTVVTSKHLLSAVLARPQPPKVVLVSSFGVYEVAPLARGTVIDERTPLESHPERRDPYSQVKLRQEQLFWEARREHDYPLVVLRPGVIYGPHSAGLSTRLGLQLPGLFLALGGSNLLPLSYVDNCADALIVAAHQPHAVGQVYNVHDDELPTCSEFLALRNREVGRLRSLPIPYPMLLLASSALERYHRYSRGQLPNILTPYRTRTTWKGHRFDNSKLKNIGWSQRISTREGLRRTFREHRR